MIDNESLVDYHYGANELLQSNKITKLEYDTFLLFENNDLGKEFLVNIIDSMFYETPEDVSRDLLSWYEGRRSVFRQIKIKINEIKQKIRGLQNE